MNPEEEQKLALNQPSIDSALEVLNEQPQTIEPEVIQQGSFPAPFQSDIGNSTVD